MCEHLIRNPFLVFLFYVFFLHGQTLVTVNLCSSNCNNTFRIPTPKKNHISNTNPSFFPSLSVNTVSFSLVFACCFSCMGTKPYGQFKTHCADVCTHRPTFCLCSVPVFVIIRSELFAILFISRQFLRTQNVGRVTRKTHAGLRYTPGDKWTTLRNNKSGNVCTTLTFLGRSLCHWSPDFKFVKSMVHTLPGLTQHAAAVARHTTYLYSSSVNTLVRADSVTVASSASTFTESPGKVVDSGGK